MKKKEFNAKLKLKKRLIAKLDHNNMRFIIGGDSDGGNNDNTITCNDDLTVINCVSQDIGCDTSEPPPVTANTHCDCGDF